MINTDLVTNISRTDTRWMNQFNTFGTSADPITRTVFGFSTRLERTELESMYRHDWVARAVVDALAEDATREWVTLVEEEGGARADDLEDAVESLDVRSKFLEAIRLSRLYGGSVMIIGAYDGQMLEEPLNEDKVNWFEFLLVLDRWQVFPRAWYRDPSHPKFGLPSHYLIQPVSQFGPTITNFIVHESRLIRFDGGFLPVRLRLQNIGWGDSSLEPVYEQLRQFGVTVQSGAAMMEDFVTRIYKMADLPEKLGAGKLGLIEERMRLAAGQLSVHGITVIGPDDEIRKDGTPIQGLSKLQEMYVTYIAGAARMPKTRLFGAQSGILGSSSADADIRTWYDSVRAFQKNRLDKEYKRLVRIKAKAEGLPEGGWDTFWKPLWQLDEVTASQIAVNYSQAHSNWIQNGVLLPEEIAESVFGSDGINYEDIVLDSGLRAKAAKQEQKELELEEEMRLLQLEAGAPGQVGGAPSPQATGAPAEKSE